MRSWITCRKIRRTVCFPGQAGRAGRPAGPRGRGSAVCGAADFREEPRPDAPRVRPRWRTVFWVYWTYPIYIAKRSSAQLTFYPPVALCAALTGRRSSVVERTIGNGEVESSILSGGTSFSPGFLRPFGSFEKFRALVLAKGRRVSRLGLTIRFRSAYKLWEYRVCLPTWSRRIIANGNGSASDPKADSMRQKKTAARRTAVSNIDRIVTGLTGPRGSAGAWRQILRGRDRAQPARPIPEQ
jgi:hypothetical protein